MHERSQGGRSCLKNWAMMRWLRGNEKHRRRERKKKKISPIMPHSGRARWRKEVWRDGVWRGCKESMQRNKKPGGGSLGAALVACLSMAHVTTGFNSQRWKNHIPKSWAAEVGWGWKKAVRWLLKGHACAALGMVSLAMGRRGRWSFIGLEPLRPEWASLWMDATRFKKDRPWMYMLGLMRWGWGKGA